MKTSVSGLNFIKTWEGLLLEAYQCQANVWTIGYGSIYHDDGSRVKEGDRITKDEAEAMLIREVAKFEDGVNALGLNLTQPQFDAIISFCYNVGIGAFKRSTLFKMIRAGAAPADIRAQFMRWNRAGGKVSTGLTRRRAAEANMFFG